MGDRCYCTVKCRESDLVAAMPDWETELGNELEYREGTYLKLTFAEVNYGNVFEDERFPRIPCIIENGAGAEYDAGITVFFDGGQSCWDTDKDNARFVFDIGSNGKPTAGAEWRAFWKKYQKAIEYLEQPQPCPAAPHESRP